MTNHTTTKVDLVKMRSWQGAWANLPPYVRFYPTMLTREELRMLRWLTQFYYSGEGVICDLGSFLGGSSIALADGYKRAGNTQKRLHSYDMHITQEATWKKYKLHEKYDYPKDGNFYHLMEKFMGKRSDVINFHHGDFRNSPIPDEKIEILFIDLAKTPEANDYIVENYFPKLIPGKSIVIQQDYFHQWPVWDIVIMELLSDYFEPLAYTEENSALFLCKKLVPIKVLQDVKIQMLTEEVMLSAIAKAAHRWPHMRQRLSVYDVYRIMLYQSVKIHSGVKEYVAKQELAKHPFSEEAFFKFLKEGSTSISKQKASVGYKLNQFMNKLSGGR